MASDFALYPNTSAGLHPLRVNFHSGGVDFADGVTTAQQDEMILSCEDLFPSGETSAWWGANENFAFEFGYIRGLIQAEQHLV